MQSQMCRICGHRHHRYEPHAFDDPKVKFMYESEPLWPAEDEARKEVMPDKPASRVNNATAPVTTAGADPPPSLAALDDTALHTLRNLVMNEWMRRERRRKRAARKEQE